MASETKTPSSDNEFRIKEDLTKTLIFFGALSGLGWIFIGIAPKIQTSVAFIWSAACLMGGTIVGFLFGIPKILQSNQSPVHYRQQVNTNLEQISDWLTKIIVGLGLIELKNVPGFLNRLAEILTKGIGLNDKAFALALIIYFTVVGFLFGYLATRLFLAGAFSRADQAATSAIEQIKSLARSLPPALLKQTLLELQPKELINLPSKAAEKETEERATDDDRDKENLEKVLREINNPNKF